MAADEAPPLTPVERAVVRALIAALVRRIPSTAAAADFGAPDDVEVGR